MLSIDLIRRNPDLVREGLTRRSEDSSIIDLILEKDEAWRQLVYQVDELRKQIKEDSKAIGVMIRKDPISADQKKEEVRILGDQLPRDQIQA